MNFFANVAKLRLLGLNSSSSSVGGVTGSSFFLVSTERTLNTSFSIIFSLL